MDRREREREMEKEKGHEATSERFNGKSMQKGRWSEGKLARTRVLMLAPHHAARTTTCLFFSPRQPNSENLFTSPLPFARSTKNPTASCLLTASRLQLLQFLVQGQRSLPRPSSSFFNQVCSSVNCRGSVRERFDRWEVGVLRSICGVFKRLRQELTCFPFRWCFWHFFYIYLLVSDVFFIGDVAKVISLIRLRSSWHLFLVPTFPFVAETWD